MIAGDVVITDLLGRMGYLSDGRAKIMVVDTFHLIALGLNHGEGGHGQARENRDDRDHHQQLDQSEGVVSLRFHSMSAFMGWL